ncbi:MAG TPA: hypothetical protein HA222_01465 [Candidatus Diapherotrites archaeon]|uniref:Uncharacterized protein n=1 Tax=Candidatus Iainarchaeum sp. TaxID=3101447 RepID=A0A7J4JU55_9ARCH|nr:hypothetical protein [Candidatus Diapherotrites archaeon]
MRERTFFTEDSEANITNNAIISRKLLLQFKTQLKNPKQINTQKAIINSGGLIPRFLRQAGRLLRRRKFSKNLRTEMQPLKSFPQFRTPERLHNLSKEQVAYAKRLENEASTARKTPKIVNQKEEQEITRIQNEMTRLVNRSNELQDIFTHGGVLDPEKREEEQKHIKNEVTRLSIGIDRLRGGKTSKELKALAKEHRERALALRFAAMRARKAGK